MAPSDKKLEAELLSAVRDIYKTNSEDLTINFVRKRVENDLDLEDGFFSSPEWKDRSKKLIKTLATELLENGAPAVSDADKDDEEDAKPKKTTAKRQSTEASPPPKRRKRASGKAEEVDDNDSESEKPKSKAKAKAKPKQKAARSKKSQDIVESEEELSAVEEKPTKARNGRASKVEASDSDALSSPPESENEKEKKETKKSKSPPNATSKEKSPVETPAEDAEEKKAEEPPVDDTSSELSELIDEPPKPKSKKAAEEPPVIDDTSSELSELIDEPPKPKRKKKEAGGGKATKAAKPKKTPAASDNPDDAEIKKLQSQLVKCGIRKIWGFELKQYGDNAKAKIKHLKGMLADVGMDGRFSEAKAREIKERRELQADLEAVQEMDANWGASGRSSRSKARGQPPAKPAREDVADEDDGGDDDDEDEEAVVSSRARGKARADLAFLGDDDEESD
ncbi:transcriptional regulator [Colletotrichum musicola]|uniref:Transcriptional regulator n=1 Tax=Colletotrichum musicola TaxID=2175873 RepID=A0A8H6KTB3_9PEZI|nr:transcriptional regulator [Colletotrichum musicola]